MTEFDFLKNGKLLKRYFIVQVVFLALSFLTLLLPNSEIKVYIYAVVFYFNSLFLLALLLILLIRFIRLKKKYKNDDTVKINFIQYIKFSFDRLFSKKITKILCIVGSIFLTIFLFIFTSIMGYYVQVNLSILK